jgi:type II restriction enzyme
MSDFLEIEDLVTNRELVIKGVLWQAKRKLKMTENTRMRLQETAQNLMNVVSFKEILSEPLLVQFCMFSEMISKKSYNHFTTNERALIIKSIITLKKLKDPDYISSLIDRNMIMEGEVIGGKMRNIIGQKGESIFLLSMIERLNDSKIKYKIDKTRTDKFSSIEWNNKKVFFNKTPKFIGKNIDFILIERNEEGDFDVENPKTFISAGEIKGGIDPAGADEHWKTASHALRRIEEKFSADGLVSPNLFFVGGAISNHMASEVLESIRSGNLTSAANLNYSDQLNSLTSNLILGNDIKKVNSVIKRRASVKI